MEYVGVEHAPRRLSLPRPSVLRLLDRLDQLDESEATTYSLRPDQVPDALPEDAAEAVGSFDKRPMGAFVFWGDRARLVVLPPFPADVNLKTAGYATADLRTLLEAPRTLGVVLVRLGGYSLGLYRNSAFVDSKTGGRFVKNRNRKGGQSQRRFERIREGQIREHFDDVAGMIRERLLPVAGELDWLVLGGDRRTVQSLLARAPLPPPLAAKLLPRTIDTPEPRRDVLEASPIAIWSSRVLVVRDPREAGG